MELEVRLELIFINNNGYRPKIYNPRHTPTQLRPAPVPMPRDGPRHWHVIVLNPDIL